MNKITLNDIRYLSNELDCNIIDNSALLNIGKELAELLTEMFLRYSNIPKEHHDLIISKINGYSEVEYDRLINSLYEKGVNVDERV